MLMTSVINMLNTINKFNMLIVLNMLKFYYFFCNFVSCHVIWSSPTSSEFTNHTILRLLVQKTNSTALSSSILEPLWDYFINFWFRKFQCCKILLRNGRWIFGFEGNSSHNILRSIFTRDCREIFLGFKIHPHWSAWQFGSWFTGRHSTAVTISSQCKFCREIPESPLFSSLIFPFKPMCYGFNNFLQLELTELSFLLGRNKKISAWFCGHPLRPPPKVYPRKVHTLKLTLVPLSNF